VPLPDASHEVEAAYHSWSDQGRSPADPDDRLMTNTAGSIVQPSLGLFCGRDGMTSLGPSRGGAACPRRSVTVMLSAF